MSKNKPLLDTLSDEELHTERDRLLRKVETTRNETLATHSRLDDVNRLIRQRRLPPEPPDRSVITFSRHLGGIGYDYAAIRIGTWWYTTAADSKYRILLWNQLVELIQDQDNGFQKKYAVMDRTRVEFVYRKR